MKSEKILREEIFNNVREFYKLTRPQGKFTPGESFINYAGRVYDDKEMISLVDSSLDFWLTAGRYTNEFEEKLAAFLGIKYCLLTNSGSSANLLAISALTSSKLGKKRLKPGDEVITTACCFPTTLAPIIQNNLVPVFIDVDLGTYNIKIDKIEEAISKKTKLIFIAHTLGNPANLNQIMHLVKKYNLWFIEDNCDALGSKYKGRYTGTFGDIATCSFYPPHMITMGEGGAALTNNPLLRKIILSFRDWGRDCYCETGHDNTCGKRFSQRFDDLPYGYDHKYVYSHIGYNLKLTDMQAAIGVEQLKKLLGFIRKRKKNFNLLYHGIKGYQDVIILPEWERQSEPCWFCFPITLTEKVGFSRQELISFLEKAKIKTRLIFAGNILRQPAFKDIKCRIVGSLKNTDIIMKDSFFIGVYPGLGHKQIHYILEQFSVFLKKNSIR